MPISRMLTATSPMSSAQFHEVHDKRLVVLRRSSAIAAPACCERSRDCARWSRSITRSSIAILGAQPVDESCGRRVRIDETFTAKDEDRQRQLVEQRSQGRRRQRRRRRGLRHGDSATGGRRGLAPGVRPPLPDRRAPVDQLTTEPGQDEWSSRDRLRWRPVGCSDRAQPEQQVAGRLPPRSVSTATSESAASVPRSPGTLWIPVGVRAATSPL